MSRPPGVDEGVDLNTTAFDLVTRLREGETVQTKCMRSMSVFALDGSASLDTPRRTEFYTEC